jgi:hypothetical protein
LAKHPSNGDEDDTVPDVDSSTSIDVSHACKLPLLVSAIGLDDAEAIDPDISNV